MAAPELSSAVRPTASFHLKPPCVILAGGRSSRMGGGDKCLLPLNGETLISRIVRTVAPQTSDILINSNSSPTLYADFGLSVRTDAISGFQGPLAGILTGMLWARRRHPDASHLLSVACDTPFLPRDLVTRLESNLRQTGADIVVARDLERIHPVIGLWRITLADQLAKDLHKEGNRAIHRWLERFRVAETVFSPRHFKNINTVSELENAQNAGRRYHAFG